MHILPYVSCATVGLKSTNEYAEYRYDDTSQGEGCKVLHKFHTNGHNDGEKHYKDSAIDTEVVPWIVVNVAEES